MFWTYILVECFLDTEAWSLKQCIGYLFEITSYSDVLQLEFLSAADRFIAPPTLIPQ